MDRVVHAIVLVESQEDARQVMERMSFAVEDGGHHPARGPAKTIVPFGMQYLE
jgi:hypothetical protein